MADTFKFIHASDLHLDQPLQGLAELPAHLKTALANAPYDAAQRVFDKAITERVDFILLSGGLFDRESAGPRTVAFLMDQFNRLMERKITVYIAPGPTDPSTQWPGGIEFPCNVISFGSSEVKVIKHHKNGTPIATIMGAAHTQKRDGFSDFFTAPSAPFPIAFTHGEIETSQTEKSNIRYWAMGGRQAAVQLKTEDGTIAFPGTPQGRSSFDKGPTGCILGQVDIDQEVHLTKVETDSFRWLPQKMTVSESVTSEELKNTLAKRALQIAAEAPQYNILLHWHLLTTGELNPDLRKSDRRTELIDWLRAEFGNSPHGCLWTTSVSIEPPNSLSTQWYAEDTILGEYLRAIGRFQNDTNTDIPLNEYLPTVPDTGQFNGMASIESEHRAEILNESAMIGINYMAAESNNTKPEDHAPRKNQSRSRQYEN